MFLFVLLTICIQFNGALPAQVYAGDPCPGKEWEQFFKTGPLGTKYQWMMYESMMTYQEAEEACACSGLQPAKITDTNKWDDIYDQLMSSKQPYEGSEPFYIGAVTDYTGSGPVPIEQISDIGHDTALSQFEAPVPGDCPGSDMVVYLLKSVDECASICNDIPDCVGILWASKPVFGPNCWIKSQLCSQPSGHEDVLSIYRKKANEDSTLSNYEAAVPGDCPGNDLGYYWLNRVEECAAVCNAKDDCVGILWASKPVFGPTCWVKSKLCPQPSGYKDVLSIYKKKGNTESALLHFEAPVPGDCPGSDMTVQWFKNVEECAALCDAIDGCVGILWASKPVFGPQCWIKSQLCSTPSGHEDVLSIYRKKPNTVAENNNDGQVGFTVNNSLQFVKLSEGQARGVLCQLIF